jgi:hypothetical protein
VPCKRLGRSIAAIPDAARAAILADQSRDLGAGQAGDRHQIAAQHAFVRAPATPLAKAPERVGNKSISVFSRRDLEIDDLTAGDKRSNVFNGLESLGMELHNHPPMIPNSGPP